MENFSYHVPFYVVTGGIKTEGHSSELNAGEVGLFDRQNWSVATPAGSGKEFFFGQGNNGGIDFYGLPVTESHKSPFFYGKDVENMYKSHPVKLQNEEWVIGFNGSTSSKGLTYEEGKPVRVKFLFTGQPTYRFFGGPKEYVVSYTPPKDCAAPCTEDDCPEPIVDCLTHTQALINKINEHIELRKFGVQAKLVNAPYTAGTPNMTKYCLTVCDNGDFLSLASVKAQLPAGTRVERTLRSGPMSTYEFCQRDGADAPGDFQQSGSVLQAVCGECPAGAAVVPAKDVYLVRRVIAGNTDLTTDDARDSFADGAAYGAADGDSRFLGVDGAVALVQIKVPAGTDIAATGSDSVEFTHTEEASCVFGAPAAISWETCGRGIASRRTLRMNSINRPECEPDADRLDDLRSALAGVEGLDLDTLTVIPGVDCVDDYIIEQDSVDCLPEDCLTNNVTFTYDHVPAFEGRSWEVVPATVAENENRKCGIRITAGYVDPKNGNCTFDISSYWEQEPVKFELSLLGEDDDVCDVKSWPTVHQAKIGRSSRQTGEWVIREVIMKDASYLGHIARFENDSLMRAKFDNNVVERIDRSAFYNLYYITFKASYGKSFRKNEQEKFTAVFAFKEGDPSQADFENRIISVLQSKTEDAVFHIAD